MVGEAPTTLEVEVSQWQYRVMVIGRGVHHKQNEKAFSSTDPGSYLVL